ncbi:MAG: hypothetical protein ABJN35_02225 [Erythrobacter sp.]
MEELLLLPVIAAAALIEPIALFIADLVGMAMGLGRRHYSKKRAVQKAEKKRLKETFK